MKIRHTVLFTIVTTGLVGLTSCSPSQDKAFATGIFEATETTVSAEQGGKLLRFDVTEGQPLRQGQEVGLVDTVPLRLKLTQLGATVQVFDAQQPDIAAETGALRQQIAKAQLEVNRFTELVVDGAAPRKQLDDARSQLQVLRKQLEALQSRLHTQTSALHSQQHATGSERALLLDQMAKCHITSPLTGTVLEKYVEPGEVVAAGRPLFKIADTGHIFLRAYITSEQLANVKVGQQLTVRTDYGNDQGKTYQGTVTWIADKSEFTPKTILTEDERADLVYAVKIAVRNDGYIKMGMYGKVMLDGK